MVPEGWEFKRLDGAATLQRGFDLPKAKRVDGNIPIISSGGVSGFHNEAKSEAPGVVTGRYGSIGDVYFISEDYWPLNTALWVKDFHGNDEKFIYYLLSRFDFHKFSDKTGVPGVNRNDLHAVKVFIPPIWEQKKVVKILSTWDQSIVITEKLLANSQQQKKALMQQLLSGSKRLVSEKNTGLKKAGYRLIPNDWQYLMIGQVCAVSSEKNTAGNSYPVLSCSKYDGFVDSLKYFKKKVYSNDTRGYKIIPRGCFGFPSNHIEEGSIGLQGLYDYGMVSPIYVVFEADQSIVDCNYLIAVLKTEHYRQIFSAATNASVDRRGSLRWKEFSSIYIPLPALSEQQKIAEVLSAAEQEIQTLQQKLTHLKQEKKSLMQQLLTGKRRVKPDPETQLTETTTPC